jgi:hypothetical protein
VPTEFGDAFCADPNGFLLAALHPAWRGGERRIRVDGELCGILSDRCRVALLTLRDWFPQLGPLPVIEAAQGFSCRPTARARAVSFLSCGIDSIATLQWNLRHVGREHPAAVWGGVVVDYIEGHGWSAEQWGAKLHAAAKQQQRLPPPRGSP